MSNLFNFKFDEAREAAIEMDDIVLSHQVKTSNILVVGASGTGKTTFIEVLKDPLYNSVFEIDSQTRESTMTKALFSVGSFYYMLNIIDTPGFGDSSSDKKTDFELEEMILKFVKSGTTELNLILITVRYGVRLEAGQVDTIMNVLRFLGKDMRANSYVLVTHSEKSTQEERKIWEEKLSKSEARNLSRFCDHRFFYTGMNTTKSAMDAENFRKSIRKSHMPIIAAAVQSKPILLVNQETNNIANQFMLYESAAKDSLTLKKLLPQLKDLASKVMSLKLKLADYSSNETACELLEKYKDLRMEDVDIQIGEWSKLQNAISDYIERGSKVQESAKAVREQYSKLNQAIKLMTDLFDDLTMFG